MKNTVQVDVKSNSEKIFKMELCFMPTKSASGTYRILDQNNRNRGWAKKVGSQFEVGFNPMGIGTVGKTFTHRIRKQALIQAVDHWNARKDGLVCSICQNVFDKKLPKYLGVHACEEHANKNFIMSL